MKCDFCMSNNPVWRYNARVFALDLGAAVYASDSGWAACDDCSCLIEVGDWDQILHKALAYSCPSMALAETLEFQKSMRLSLELLYEVFRGVRVGARVLA